MTDATSPPRSTSTVTLPPVAPAAVQETSRATPCGTISPPAGEVTASPAPGTWRAPAKTRSERSHTAASAASQMLQPVLPESAFPGSTVNA